jgi:hypothetical protein
MDKNLLPFIEIGGYLIEGNVPFVTESYSLMIVREYSLTYKLFQELTNLEAEKLKGFFQFLIIGVIGIIIHFFRDKFV